MTSVRAFPRAEQYPSNTASSSAGTSSLISGISGGLLNASFGMEREKCVTFRPLRLRDLAVAQLRKRAGRYADAIRNSGLGKPGILNFRNDFVPVHDDSFSTSRNITLRHVETQVMDNQTMMTLAQRLTNTREEKGLSKADLRRLAGLKSPSTLTELESGQRTESPQLPKIAAALGVEVMWLQHGTGPKRRKDIALAASTAAEIAALANELPPKQQAELLHYLRFAKLLRESGVSDDLLDAIRQSSGSKKAV